MKRIAKVVEKYCRVHAEAEVAGLQHFPHELRFDTAVVIPAYREGTAFLERLQDLAKVHSRLLSILVINQPEDDPDVRQALSLHDFARRSGPLRWERDSLELLEWGNGSFLLLVNRFDEDRRIAARQGVGLARKIGFDLAVELHRREQLQTTLIHSTDADAHLPLDYFRQTEHLPANTSAAVYPFRHKTCENPLGRATRLYEQSLRYYVRGLSWAGSPYAFHTVGSCLAASPEHYCMARGFPKRAGGEDFYLLNKLAKVAPVVQTSGAAIELEARRSRRVPFGTGPAVEKILSLPDSQEFRTYNPGVFGELATALNRFGDLWPQRDNHQQWLDSLPGPVRTALLEEGIEDLLSHLRVQANTREQYQRNIHAWFDAFRTLKFIHHLQEHGYPAVPLSVALEESDKLFQHG